MKLTPILLIPLLFLSSCTIDWNDEKDTKIASLNTKIEELNKKLDEQKEEIKKVKEDELFKKNKECLGFFDSIKKRLKEYDSNYTFELEEIFYSPILKQCVYVDIFGPKNRIKRLMSIGSNVGGNPINELSCDFDGASGCISFDEKIQELKGE